MRLTLMTDYALRVLMYAAAQRDRLVTVDEIAQAYGISKNHLTKVVQELGRQGFLETTRGRGGGIRLGRAPESITVGNVVRAMEEDFDLVECHRDARACRISSVCRLRGTLDEAMQAFVDVLDRRSLAELVARPKALIAALSDA